MSRLSNEQITKEIRDKDFYPHDISGYENLNSPIKVRCRNNHIKETTLYDFRKASFMCHRCGADAVLTNKVVPPKQGFRIIGLDNATQDMGISIFDNGTLVFYTLMKFSGRDFEKRLHSIYNTVNDIIMEDWQPDMIAFEDIQYQANYQTYKKLAMLLGILIVAARNNGIDYEVVSPNTWRSHYQITGNRRAVKAQAINKVATIYNITVGDDVAEAILIGKYLLDTKASQALKKAF